MLPNPVCFADHPEVRARAGSLRAFLCAGATHALHAHANSNGIRRTTRPCDNPARTARSKLASQSIESLRDFARESASSSPMRQSGPFSAPAWPRRRQTLFCCYVPVIRSGVSRQAAQNGPRRGLPIVFSLLLTMGGHWTAVPSVRRGQQSSFARATPPRSAAGPTGATSGRPTAA